MADTNTEVMKEFFELVFKVLYEENGFLLNHLSERDIYKDYPHGSLLLFETTIAYLIFRKNLSTKSDLLIRWEEPYPDKSNRTCDLALVNDGEKAYIEMKLRRDIYAPNPNNDLEKIKQDMKKMIMLSSIGIRCFELVIWIDNDKVSAEKNLMLLEDDIKLKVVNRDFFVTSIFNGRRQKAMTCMIVLFELA